MQEFHHFPIPFQRNPMFAKDTQVRASDQDLQAVFAAPGSPHTQRGDDRHPHVCQRASIRALACRAVDYRGLARVGSA